MAEWCKAICPLLASPIFICSFPGACSCSFLHECFKCYSMSHSHINVHVQALSGANFKENSKFDTVKLAGFAGLCSPFGLLRCESHKINRTFYIMFGMTPMFGMTFFVAWKKYTLKNLCFCHDLAANYFITLPKVQGFQICPQI